MAQAAIRPEEVRAGEVVRRLLQAQRVVHRDVDGSSGMYDLDVVREDAVVASVEVTIVADSAMRQTWNEKSLARHRRNDELRCGWSVTFSHMETLKLNEVMPTVREHLVTLEAGGILEVDATAHRGHNDSDHPLRQALRELGVLSVEVIDGLAPGCIVLSSIAADTLGWHDLEDALEVVAALKANQLAKASPDVERILFAWVDLTRQDLAAQLDRWASEPFGPPPRSLDLPQVVDTVIVGVLAAGHDRFYRWPGFSPFDGG